MTAPAKAKNGKRKTEAPYYWFQGPSVRAIADAIAGGGPNPRVEVRIKDKKMTVRVVPEGSTAAAATNDINDSFLCPPRCPPK